MELFAWFSKSLTDDVRALHMDCIAELRSKSFSKSLISTHVIEGM